MSSELWKWEHGEDYAVPDEIRKLVESGWLRDESWHNDACPRFTRGYPQIDPSATVSLWVEHPDPKQQEVQLGRFAVIIHHDGTSGNDVISTDDLALALKTLEWTDRLIVTRFRDLKEMRDSGELPHVVNNFGDVHNFCDANMLGDADKVMDVARAMFPNPDPNCPDDSSEAAQDFWIRILGAVDGLLDWWLRKHAQDKLPDTLAPDAWAGLLCANNKAGEVLAAKFFLKLDRMQVEQFVWARRFAQGGNLPGHIHSLVHAAYQLGKKEAGSP